MMPQGQLLNFFMELSDEEKKIMHQILPVLSRKDKRDKEHLLLMDELSKTTDLPRERILETIEKLSSRIVNIELNGRNLVTQFTMVHHDNEKDIITFRFDQEVAVLLIQLRKKLLV